MAETGNERAGFQHNIFLQVFVSFGHWLQLGVAAVGAGIGRRRSDHLVNVLGLGALPGRMADRSAALFALSRTAL